MLMLFSHYELGTSESKPVAQIIDLALNFPISLALADFIDVTPVDKFVFLS